MMKPTGRLVIAIALVLAICGCGSSGSGTEDAGSACRDFCDHLSECGFGEFSAEGCEAACDRVDEISDDFSRDCEDALVGVFECLSDLSCSVQLELMMVDLEDLENAEDLGLLQQTFQEIVDSCEGAGRELVDECAEEL